MPSLLMLSPAPLIEKANGDVLLDAKFVEGMKLHSGHWPGPVRCILWRGNTRIDNTTPYVIGQMGFELIVLDQGAPVPQLLLDETSLVYCSADDMANIDLAHEMNGRFGKIVFTVKLTLAERLATNWSQPTRLRKRLGSVLWQFRNAGRFREALYEANGIHCNGYAAYRAYRRRARHSLHYLDSRLSADHLATSAELEARAARLTSGAPLRLTWFGKMTPESGVMDFLPIAHLLASRGMQFEFELFGKGPLEQRLRDGISGLGLSDRMRLNEPADLDGALVPYLRKNADIFLSARKLPAPVDAYVEAMGAGLPILGYSNAMLKSLEARTSAVWCVKKGSYNAMVRALERLDQNRDPIIAAAPKAVEFASGNTFETVFSSRMDDLKALVGAEFD